MQSPVPRSGHATDGRLPGPISNCCKMRREQSLEDGMPAAGIFDLSGRSAIVTGAGSGLGRAFAHALAEYGASVVCADIDAETAETTAQAIDRDGGRALAVQCDVADEPAVARLIDHTVEQLGQLDVIFCNAGFSESAPVWEYSTERWNALIAVNLTGVFLCAREAARVMLPRRRGKIIPTASMWGQVGGALKPVPAYAASKGGVVNLTRELAVELGPHGITVNAIAPGIFRTNIGGGRTFRDPELLQRARALAPLGRTGEPEDLKGTAVFLASSASDFMTGQVLTVDGGWTAW